MKRWKIGLDFVAALTGMSQRNVAEFIKAEIFPFSEFAAAHLKEGARNHNYCISLEKLREHFPFTDEELNEFYESKRQAG